MPKARPRANFAWPAALVSDCTVLSPLQKSCRGLGCQCRGCLWVTGEGRPVVSGRIAGFPKRYQRGSLTFKLPSRSKALALTLFFLVNKCLFIKCFWFAAENASMMARQQKQPTWSVR